MPKVLIVEDDEFLADAYTRRMQQRGWQLDLVRTGSDAIKHAKKRPDIIVLDLVLPNMTGLDVLKKLQEDDKLSQIPVVVASNLDEQEVVDQAMQLGAVDYYIKSRVRIDELIATCEKHMPAS